jgi:hypothetical protein
MVPIKGNKGQNSPKQGMKLPRRQRALVLQGGTSVGAINSAILNPVLERRSDYYNHWRQRAKQMGD